MRSRTFSDEGWVGDAGATRCNAPHAAIRDGGAAGRGGPSDADRIRVAVLRCPRPIGRRPVRMQQLRCSSWLGLLHQLASEHAPPLLLGVVLCRPPATAPDGALVLIGARGGVGAPGTTHQASPPPQKPFLANRRMHDQIRPVAGAVPPPGCPVLCPGP